MNGFVILDTSVFINHLRTGCHEQRIRSLTGFVRTSAVVLAELWLGSTKPAERAFVMQLEKNHPVLAPTERNWVALRQILDRIRLDKPFLPHRAHDLFFDVLIALTASSHGARLITSGAADFELIRQHCHFRHEVW